jgi:hypothetical protein
MVFLPGTAARECFYLLGIILAGSHKQNTRNQHPGNFIQAISE